MTRNDAFFSIDQLEKDFDRAVIHLDQLLIQSNLISVTSSISKDKSKKVTLPPKVQSGSKNSLKNQTNSKNSNYSLNDPYRNNLSTISSSFSTLLQYTLTLAELNAKLEAELLNVKDNLVDSKSLNETHGRLEDDLVHQLHAAQLSALNATNNNSNNSNNKSSTTNAANTSLESEIASRRLEIKSDESVMVERNELRSENEYLRDELAKTTGDLYAARLASKYLDKELAGRIQQIQLIGKGKMSTEDFGKLWTQLESEIFLHRQKTLVQACRANISSGGGEGEHHALPSSKKLREVKFLKREDEQLGLSITGGEDVGCPIIISDIGEDGVAAKTGEVVVGDAILSINGMKLKGLKHSEAAAVLSNANGEIVLEVQFLIPDYHKITDENEKIEVEPETSESIEVVDIEVGPKADSKVDPKFDTEVVAHVDDVIELETAETETTEIGENEDKSVPE